MHSFFSSHLCPCVIYFWHNQKEVFQDAMKAYKDVQFSVHIDGFFTELGPANVSPHLIPLQVFICMLEINKNSFELDNWHVVTEIAGYMICIFVHNEKRKEPTTGSGASACLHITHGTPVSSSTAIFAAHRTYEGPFSPKAASMFWYSFSICMALVFRFCNDKKLLKLFYN